MLIHLGELLADCLFFSAFLELCICLPNCFRKLAFVQKKTVSLSLPTLKLPLLRQFVIHAEKIVYLKLVHNLPLPVILLISESP